MMLHLDFVPQEHQAKLKEITAEHGVTFPDAYIKIGFKTCVLTVDGLLNTKELACLQSVMAYVEEINTVLIK